MSQKKILILTASHLCRNPRVVKEATTLGTAGYDVTVMSISVQERFERLAGAQGVLLSVVVERHPKPELERGVLLAEAFGPLLELGIDAGAVHLLSGCRETGPSLPEESRRFNAILCLERKSLLFGQRRPLYFASVVLGVLSIGLNTGAIVVDEPGRFDLVRRRVVRLQRLERGKARHEQN